MITSSKYIDNTQTTYIPIRLSNGITLQCIPQIFNECPSIIQVLEADLNDCIAVLPPSIHNFITRIKIWINISYSYGPIDDPRVLKHTTAHHHRQWLETVNDLPEKARGVELYNCFEYLEMRLHWNGCGLLLHELCHLIHQLILQDGLDNEMVLDAFGEALESGLYDSVLRRDWAFPRNGSGEDQDTAYCTINHKEFFSELSVAFLSTGYDGKLRGGVGSGGRIGVLNKSMVHCSPPFMAADVLERMSESGYQQQVQLRVSSSANSWIESLKNTLFRQGRGHCNKFFPFTHGQLHVYDPNTFAVFQQIWSEIADWNDPVSRGSDGLKCEGCIPIPFQKSFLGFCNRTDKKLRVKDLSQTFDESSDTASEHPTDEFLSNTVDF